MRVTYIGHATLLLEFGGLRILTDPNFDARLVGLLPRVAPPGIAAESLPPIDLILLTHAHADHLSFASLDRLPNDVPILAPPPVARWLKRRGYACARETPAGTPTRLGPVTIHAAPAAHHGSRYGVDRWGGRDSSHMYLLDDGAASCFFAGDTALRPNSPSLVQRELGARRQLDLALLPIGHAPWWKPGFRRGHLTYSDALELFDRLGGRVFVPYHWGTFRHVTSSAHAAIDRLRAALPTHPARNRVRILEPGETLDLPAPLLNR